MSGRSHEGPMWRDGKYLPHQFAQRHSIYTKVFFITVEIIPWRGLARPDRKCERALLERVLQKAIPRSKMHYFEINNSGETG